MVDVLLMLYNSKEALTKSVVLIQYKSTVVQASCSISVHSCGCTVTCRGLRHQFNLRGSGRVSLTQTSDCPRPRPHLLLQADQYYRVRRLEVVDRLLGLSVNRPLSVADSYWPSPSLSRPQPDLVSGVNLAEGTVEEFTASLKG